MKKNKITPVIAVLLSLLVVVSACGAAVSKESSNYAYDQAAGVAMEEYAMEAPMAAAPMAEPSAERGVSDVAGTNTERIVIQNVDMGIVVPDPVGKMDQISAMAERFGGYVVSRYTYQNRLQSGVTVPEGSITVRVPSDRLDEALDEIKTQVTETRYENRDGQDVTDRYVDLQSQLKAKQAAETKLYEIMDQAETAEETLLVFNQLQSVQNDIEVLKGQINYYEQSAALSSIAISISADETIQPIEVGGWQARGVAKDAIESLIRFFQGFASFIIWFVVFIAPVLLVLIFFVWVLWKIFGGMIKKLFKKSVPKDIEEEKKE